MMKRIPFILSCLLATAFLFSCKHDDPNNGKDEGESKEEEVTVPDTPFDADFNPDAPALAGTVGRIDMNYLYKLKDTDARVWDDLHAIATLQGVVNRNTATLYINYVGLDGHDIDQYWWDKYSGAGGWLAGRSTKQFSTVVEAISEYKDKIKGVVVYDPAVASTSNIASAVAGIENLVAIRYDPSDGSLYSQVVSGGLKLPVKVWLLNQDGTSMFTGTGTIPGTQRASSGSTKCDPYYWFIDNYIKTGKCDTRWGGYYIDQFWRTCPQLAQRNHHCLTNHDFFVSKKAFFCDLSPWGDERATDDPTQPVGADLKTLKELLRAAYDARDPGQMCYIGGFPSWAHKYTSFKTVGGRHQEVATEWEYTQIISGYNACMDADAIAYGALANASFWQHFPLKDKYEQEWVTRESLKARGLLDEDGKVNLSGNRQYFIIYCGDYDASSWIYQRSWDIWDDPARGSVPLMWAIGPALCLRSPQVMHYFYTTRTANDYFVAADNGAGYLNPGELQTPRASGLPSGIETWRKHCKKYYDMWGMTITGFIIDGNSIQMNDANLDAYATFSPNGIVPQNTTTETALHNGMPVLRSRGIGLGAGTDTKEAAASLISQIKQDWSANGRRFHWCRVVLAKPSWYKEVLTEVENQSDNIIYLDAPSFFELLRIYKEK